MTAKSRELDPRTADTPEADWMNLFSFADDRRNGSQEVPVLALNGGATLGIERAREADRLTIRAPRGEVLLRIMLGPEGPVLSFGSAEIEVEATRRVAIIGETVEVRAHGRLELSCGDDLNVSVGGRRHSRIQGRDLTEAEAIESQANEGDVVLRAKENVRVDGEHIGLNDDRCPGPLPWTRPARKGGV